MFEHIDKELDAIVERLPQSREGFITPDQADFLYHFVLLTRPRIVAETGFHVGHSACVILKAMERYGGGTLISFDIARYEETTQAAEMVKGRFEGFHLIAGDSKETLAGTLGQILSSNPGATLDFAIVDGGHDIDTARSDMLIMETLLKPGGYPLARRLREQQGPLRPGEHRGPRVRHEPPPLPALRNRRPPRPDDLPKGLLTAPARVTGTKPRRTCPPARAGL